MDNKSCLYKTRNGEILSWCTKKNTLCNIYKHKIVCQEKKIREMPKLKREIEYEQSQLYFLGENDGNPIMNEYHIREENTRNKRKERELKIVQEYHEKKRKEELKELKEFTDDLFDSKGKDISEEEYLKNEKEFVYFN